MTESVDMFLRNIKDKSWDEQIRAIDIEISASRQCVKTWKGHDPLGLSYAKRHIEDLIASMQSLIRLVREGHYHRFRA
jgi:hypothetical protein